MAFEQAQKRAPAGTRQFAHGRPVAHSRHGDDCAWAGVETTRAGSDVNRTIVRSVEEAERAAIIGVVLRMESVTRSNAVSQRARRSLLSKWREPQ
jgi:hypothetical protein